MSNPEPYDVVFLGSGVAGKLLGWTLAAQGKRVAVIERRYVGGSCPNIACLPSKSVIHGAKVASYFRRDAEFGIAAGDWKVDMPGVCDRKRKVSDHGSRVTRVQNGAGIRHRPCGVGRNRMGASTAPGRR